MAQTPPSNFLLSLLPPNEIKLLTKHFEAVSLHLREHLEHAGESVEYAYFLESGIASVVSDGSKGHRQIEIGLIDREGVTALPVILGNDRSPHSIFVQMRSTALELPAAAFREALAQSPVMRALMLKYAQAFLVQVSQTAVVNGLAQIEERLARWILMSHDRSDGVELTLTHEFLSTMLGVRRSSVTDTVNALVGRGVIRASRGIIVVLDRPGLTEIAGRWYGLPEREYHRLFGGALSERIVP